MDAHCQKQAAPSNGALYREALEMDEASQRLVAMINDEDAFSKPMDEVETLQLQAAQAVLCERRGQVPVLDRRASAAGIDSVRRRADLVPLLFAHTTYKSYPSSFIERKQWKNMQRWLTTISSGDATGVATEGIEDEDAWVQRLRVEGHQILATSGTSGKCSFLDHSADDTARKFNHFSRVYGWPYTRPRQDRAFVWLGPQFGADSAVQGAQIAAEVWAPPEKRRFLTDEPVRLTEISAMAAMRKRMAEGSATPGEIADFEASAARKADVMGQKVRALTDFVLDQRQEPMVLTGMWSQHMSIIARAKERGIKDGDFHPDTVLSAVGGVKAIALPKDYKEQVQRFYGEVIRPSYYGMTEMFLLMPCCEAGRYHVPPGQIPLVLDDRGEKLLNGESVKDSVVEGRYAFVDLAIDGRWSGCITSDRVQLDTSPICRCGRSGPTILDSVRRIAAEDDHIGCAGTIDAYITGALAA